MTSLPPWIWARAPLRPVEVAARREPVAARRRPVAASAPAPRAGSRRQNSRKPVLGRSSAVMDVAKHYAGCSKKDASCSKTATPAVCCSKT